MSKIERALEAALVNKTSARMILDSVTPYGDQTRLSSIYCVFPKFVLAEMNTHASHARSDRSSRAVPPEKLIEEVRSGEGLAMPAVFRKRTRGMGGGEELVGTELRIAQRAWVVQALMAADAAEDAVLRGEEKETANRHLDSYIYAHSLRTSTRDGWLNFLGLRLENASPTIMRLARCVYRELKNSTPELRRSGEWHLPFTNTDDDHELFDYLRVVGRDNNIIEPSQEMILEELLVLSPARCAHLSYNAAGTAERIDLEKAHKINLQLRTVPLHAGPFEHLAQVDEKVVGGSRHAMTFGFAREHLRGKFCPGWVQYRKTLPGEAVAPLPEGYDPL